VDELDEGCQALEWKVGCAVSYDVLDDVALLDHKGDTLNVTIST
jgi:hypothetical protein